VILLACACAGPIVLKTGVACLLVGLGAGAWLTCKALS
jgi:hypothetical protein